MKHFLTILLFLSIQAFADDYKFHYGDRVIIHSSKWRKPCFDDEFLNVCGKIGIVTDVQLGNYCEHLYSIRFEFKGLENRNVAYCEEHLKRAK